MDRARAVNALVEDRATKVQLWLLEGHTRSAIIEKASPWKLSDRQIDDYISRAKKIIRELNEVEREDNLAAITANLWDLFREAKMPDQEGASNIQEAHKILMSIAKVRGLEETTVTHKVERPLEQFTPAELHELLDKAKK